MNSLDIVLSDVPGVAWPPVATGARATLIGVAERLERSQWFAPEELVAGQHRQLVLLARHAAAQSPQFAARLGAAGLSPDDLATPEGLCALPLLSRADLQLPPATVDCAAVPPGHGSLESTSSSGSTGEPVTVRKTALTILFWRALTVRWHDWSAGDARGRIGIVRANVTEASFPNWGDPIATLFQTGPACVVDTRADYDAIAAAFGAFDPEQLLIYPSILAAMLDRIDDGRLTLPSLRHIRMLGETVPDQVRDRAREIASVSGCYSTAELGYLTIECPVSGLHHVQCESAIVEVLRADGTPAREGESGRVVATALHNFATPLIRYDVGDWAEVGPACQCGRGLPTLTRILGRTRNRMIMPDGRERWAMTGSIRYNAYAPVGQTQLVQHARDRLELRYTAAAPLAPDIAARVIEEIQKTTDPGFAVDLTHVEGRLDDPRSGKFEEFVSRLG